MGKIVLLMHALHTGDLNTHFVQKYTYESVFQYGQFDNNSLFYIKCNILKFFTGTDWLMILKNIIVQENKITHRPI